MQLLAPCPHGTTLLPLDGFSRNLILEYFFKICQEISSFFKNKIIIMGTLHEDKYTVLIKPVILFQ
jgi:hypothetical protein